MAERPIEVMGSVAGRGRAVSRLGGSSTLRTLSQVDYIAVIHHPWCYDLFTRLDRMLREFDIHSCRSKMHLRI